MRTITYYVATSIDGYISGPGGDIEGFLPYEDVIEKYQKDLLEYDTTIMGRNTYEFGYKYGLIPGQPAYPHMRHYIFSNSMKLENTHEQVHICQPSIEKIEEIRRQDGTEIYLCGGGAFAGWLLENRQIGKLIIKLNPFIQGDGVPIFGNSNFNCRLHLENKQGFPEGLQLLEYSVHYPE